MYRFLQHKWYFDEFYSVAVVRPGLVVAGWCRWFDTNVIDGVAARHRLADHAAVEMGRSLRQLLSSMDW